IEMNDTVSTGIIHYVAHTKETIVLADAANEGDFTNDDIIQYRQSRSVLCTPLINQGRISGILYLENNLTTAAFTTERVELLKLLSSEMALALDNAQLYANLERSEEKFRGVFNTMIDVFTRSDMDGTCLVVSPSVYDLLGYKQEEVLGRNLSDFYKDPSQRKELLKKLKDHGSVENFEIDIVRKDGTTITISANAKMYFNSKGEPLGVESNFRDVTKQKEAASNILEYQNKLKALANELILSEEKQRRQIATDLHDHVGQILASSRLQIAALNKSMGKEDILKKLNNIFFENLNYTNINSV
ncbi:MAG: PAS domain S-box protein, partial [Cyclobacteriaceae bacterium]|nr:PAS domain S-box protein [Cyclobacteriaceae bacterium]